MTPLKTLAKWLPKGLRTVSAAALLAACIFFSIGCSSQTETATTSDTSDETTTSDVSKELTAGSTTYFYAESMDPASDWDSWYLSYYGIVENLFKVSNDLTPEPWLAESAMSDDNQTWTIQIKDGIRFSNGEPVDAAAVKAAWERTYAENSRGSETLPIEEITTEGQTLTVVTQEPVTDFKNTLCDPILCVYYVGDDVDYANDTPATGPYKKVEFVAEDHIIMEPNTDYWNGTPKLDRITLVSFTDNNTLTMAMQNGEVDAIAMPSASSRAALVGDGYQTFTRTTSRADFIRMNMAHPLIANEAIRTAIASCIDRVSYSNVVCQGSAVPSWGVYSDTLPFGGTEDLKLLVSEFSVKNAEIILDEAGIIDTDNDGIRELDGTPVELSLYTCTNYERFVQEADDLQSNLAEAGISLKIVPTDYFLEDIETFNNDDPDMCFDSCAMAPTGNQAYFANIQFATNGSSNFGKYSNATVDKLIQTLNATQDTDERNHLTRQIAQQVLNDTPFIFFANPDACVIAREGVSGLDAAPSEYYFITVDANVE